MIRGMCELTGKEIRGEDYLRQCLKRILFTAKETMRNYRDFGSDIPDILGSPRSAQTILNLCSEGAQALEKWIPGFEIINVSLDPLAPESGVITMSVTYKYNDQESTLKVTHE